MFALVRVGMLLPLGVLVSLVSPVFGDSPGTPVRLPAGFEQRTYRDDSGDHRYLVFRPPEYTTARRWPVVLALHGASEVGRDGLLPLAGQLAVELERNPHVPFLVVFPQCENVNGRAHTNWRASSPDGQRALKILEQVERTDAVDSQHRILCGWSMGGYGAWSLAAAHPELWSSVLIISGGGSLQDLSLEALAQRRTPVWAVHGSADQVVAPVSSQELITKLNAVGGNGTFTSVPDGGHDVWRLVFANPRTFDWLLKPNADLIRDISFKDIEPLPARTRFYREVLTRRYQIPAALGISIANSALESAAPQLPDLISPDSLSGELPDIRRSMGTGGAKIDVRFSGLHYDCELAECHLEGISGGRLKARFAFHPLTLTIAKTELISDEHRAQTGPFAVRIGTQRPAVLELEVQPVMEKGQLHLRLLRQSFEIAPGNWYIAPPEKIQVQSRKYTASHIATGIVGSLYQEQTELSQQVLQVVPTLLQKLERELSAHDAPRLARLLSPLPVLVPELSISASGVHTDRHGIALIFDVDVLTRGAAGRSELQFPMTLQSVQSQAPLSLGVALEALTVMSQLSVEQDQAHVNVLDIGDEGFDRLTNSEVMARAFPMLRERNPGTSLQTVLRLVEPVKVEARGSTGGPNAVSLPMSFGSSRVALDFWEQSANQSLQPIGRVTFSLTQPLLIESIAASGDASPGTRIRAVWLPECDVQYLGAESLEGSPVPDVNPEEFVTLVREAWQSWAAGYQTQTIDLNALNLGSLPIQLQGMEAEQRQLKLKFELGPQETKQR